MPATAAATLPTAEAPAVHATAPGGAATTAPPAGAAAAATAA